MDTYFRCFFCAASYENSIRYHGMHYQAIIDPHVDGTEINVAEIMSDIMLTHQPLGNLGKILNCNF